MLVLCCVESVDFDLGDVSNPDPGSSCEQATAKGSIRPKRDQREAASEFTACERETSSRVCVVCATTAAAPGISHCRARHRESQEGIGESRVR